MPRINSLNTFVLSTVVSGGTVSEEANYQGATMVFVLQGTAPTGWIKDTSDNDYTLRCVSGSASSGGSTVFTSVMSSKTLFGAVPVTGTLAGTSLDSTQIPAHQHSPYAATVTVRHSPTMVPGPTTSLGRTTSLEPGQILQTGGKTTGQVGDAHDHPVGPGSSPATTFATVDLAIKYVDSILATRT